MHLQSTYTLHLQYIKSEAHLESSQTSAVEFFAEIVNVLKSSAVFCRRALSWMFDRILNATSRNNSFHLHQKLTTFPGMFEDIARNVWQHCLKSLVTFPVMFQDISRNV